jgi:DNA primase
MKMDGLDFPEALRVLGKRVGVEVPRFNTTQSNENQRLIQLNEFAAACFHKVLRESPNAAEARAYAERRGLTSVLIEKFNLGFAPEAWDALAKFLEKKGFNLPEAERAGLVQRRKSGDGFIDRFRKRLMVPLRDHHGNTVAFTGRTLPLSPTPLHPPSGRGETSDEGPKYMNSPETAVYHKGELLFGLDLAKRAIKDAKCVVVVEGNLDVIASHKAGVENVVASSGTALTARQLDLLKRHTTNLVFAFDADAAGFNAARRGIQLARANGFSIKVALLPPEAGKDPDEAVQKDPMLWQRAVAHTIPVMQYFIERSVAGKDLSNVEAKREIGALLLPEIATIDDVIEREHWLQTVADLLRVDIDALRRALPSRSDASAGVRPAIPSAANTRPRSRAHLAAEGMFAIFLQLPDKQLDTFDQLTAAHIPEGELRELYSFFASGYTFRRFSPSAANQSYFGWISGILKGEPTREHLLPLIERLALQGEALAADVDPKELDRQLVDHLHILEASMRDSKRKDLEAQIRQAEARGDHDSVAKLLEEFTNLY